MTNEQIESLLKRLNSEVMRLSIELSDVSTTANSAFEENIRMSQKLSGESAYKIRDFHPFQQKISDNNVIITIGKGIVYAGIYARYAWPDTGDVQTVSAAGRNDGDYLIYMDVSVNPTYGHFSSSYKPVLSILPKASFADVQRKESPLEGDMGAGCIIGMGTVRDNVWSRYLQRWHNDIYVPVFKVCSRGTPGGLPGESPYEAELTNISVFTIDDVTSSFVWADPPPPTWIDNDLRFLDLRGSATPGGEYLNNIYRIGAFRRFFNNMYGNGGATGEYVYIAGWYHDIFWAGPRKSGEAETTGGAI